MCSDGTNVLEHVRGGRLKAYAVLSKQRWSAASDIPTVDDAGLPGFYIVQWRGLWAPNGTPAEIVGRIHTAVVSALSDPGLRERAAALGQAIVPAEQQTPEALGAHQQAEIAKWWPIFKATHVRSQ
jgi:tripartite-type tricarboxylate transporter receptor subunit TctC